MLDACRDNRSLQNEPNIRGAFISRPCAIRRDRVTVVFRSRWPLRWMEMVRTVHSQRLERRLLQPNIEIGKLFRRVRDDVLIDTADRNPSSTAPCRETRLYFVTERQAK